MRSLKKINIGSGMSSFIYFLSNDKKIDVCSSNDNKIHNRSNFYELNAIGGNTNIWGGYINFKRHIKFLKKLNYRKVFNSNHLNINKFIVKSSKFSNTYCMTDKKGEIFRLNQSMFGKKIIKKNIDKIIIEKNVFKLLMNGNEFLYANKVIFCTGNLGLLKLLYNSEIISPSDVISFDDGTCNYVLNTFINQKKYYYIPMPIKFIIEKLLLNKSSKYQLIKNTLILQKFSNNFNEYRINCEDLFKTNKSKIRYFLSNHIANLRVNNVPIRKFLRKKSKNIDVYCSGTLKKYRAGPVIQDLIFDIVDN